MAGMTPGSTGVAHALYLAILFSIPIVGMTTREQSKMEFKERYVCFVAIFVLVSCVVYQQTLVAVIHLDAVNRQVRTHVEDLQGQIQSLRGNLEDLQSQITREEDLEQEGSKKENIFLEDESVDEGSLDKVLLARGYIDGEKRNPQERGRKGKGRDRQKHHRQESDATT
ncbi:unnamed protein product [Darwinula stevensoni]|uniref:Uncharacterized protein n=1 Tax=Darwinula stevensoni TaxID=69355 RepID=A0A7R9A7Z6_9CRUS|nr:unnamed protein product [Darwinula stevensoni]CAG0894229.1 unnamed protein product [Darwinula stevensoni]